MLVLPIHPSFWQFCRVPDAAQATLSLLRSQLPPFRALHPSRVMSTSSQAPDWSPQQYLLFQTPRNRPIHDLLTFLTTHRSTSKYSPTRIIDLGCGPGNSTSLLAPRFPNATITGVDSSPAMLATARITLPQVEFVQADAKEYEPPLGTDLVFSNAMFHWLRSRDRIPTVERLVKGLEPGKGVFAMQVPDNFDEPSHRAMRETAAVQGTVWSEYFAGSRSGDGDERPELDPIEPEMAWYDILQPLCRSVETWTTRYVHVLDGHRDIVEWVRGTGLQPFLNRLPPDQSVRDAFLQEYQRRLEAGYPRARDGKVLLGYPRRFLVAYR
ncbi:hypothetical protein VTJ83DRAFT_7577 [Remersonia thermophila]|uniref:Methyltransferase domain-containing protein n=1 Tax=Remersonia thermophila TaxID=72144 RepID=A0ABR4D688_9PEZI